MSVVKLQVGTHAYPLPDFTKPGGRGDKLPTEDQAVADIEEILEIISKQGGKIVCILPVQVEYKPASGESMRRGGKTVQFMMVEKRN